MDQDAAPMRMRSYFENELRSVEAKLATHPHPSISLDYQRIKVDLDEYINFLDQMIAEMSKIPAPLQR